MKLTLKLSTLLQFVARLPWIEAAGAAQVHVERSA